MKCITAIVLLSVAVCSQNFDSHATFLRTANANSVRPQSDSSTYLSTSNTQESLENSQTFQRVINSQQNDTTSYHIKQPSLPHTPSKIGYSACGQSSSMPYSTSRSSNQQYLSKCEPRGFKGPTSYNPQFSHSVLLPLNIRESSKLPLFSSTSSRFLRSVSKTGRQLGGFAGGNEAIAFASPPEPVFRIDSINREKSDYDFNHPPHIHNLDVECSKTMMTINIEFNRAFDGIIYSKGYYTNPECIYVKQNSGSTQYSFTVNLDSCGTQFINDFESAAGQAYLENVLVLQNEPDIQEVWDTVQSVRCLWEGNINKFLTVNLSVDMLNQEIVTFSGDTATAKLDIQIGKGPFAPTANGLVKIGETMTLVVSVEGDPGFDLQVRDCVARDEASTNMLQLTDERGCILKPKLFGAFQKTKDTDNTDASIIAYAFFQAFKFPDVMDLFIECNVELCKTNCEPCPETNQQIDPGRRRRSVIYAPSSSNSTNSVLLSDPVRVGRHFKVIMLDDINVASSHILGSVKEVTISVKEICMSISGFYMIFLFMLSTLFVAIINAVVLYIKLQRIRKPKFIL